MASPPTNFYVYLTNRGVPPGTARAKAELPTRMDLSSLAYEMALIEVQAPRHWYNVVDCYYQIFNLIKDKSPLKTNSLSIPDNYYKNFNEIFKLIAKQTELAENRIAPAVGVAPIAASNFAKFFKDSNNNNFIVLAPNAAIGFSERFRLLLGLNSVWQTNVTENGQEKRIRVFPNIFLDQYSVMAKCGLVAPSFVENRTDNILRIFSSGHLDENQMLNLSFNPIYVPLATNSLDRIEVEIRDMRGNTIKTYPGEIVFLIHLRRIMK